MTTYNFNNLRLINNIVDNADPTKQVKLSLTDITTATTRTLTVPNANTTIVGTDVAQTLTNKTIQGTTNTVDANALKTTGASVSVVGSAPPSTGYTLQATSATTATWQIPPVPLYYFNTLGTVTTPIRSNIKQFFGYSTSTAGTATFQVTTDGLESGTAIFTSMTVTSVFMQVTGVANTTSNTAVPLCSVVSVTNSGRTVNVAVKTGNTGSILIGGTYTGLQNAPDGSGVYLYIVGL